MGLLKDSRRRTTSVQWPAEVDAHLDLLVRLAADEGIPMSRAQMLSALVANASLSGPTVAKMVRRYLGQLKVGDLARGAPRSEDLPQVRHRGRQRTHPTQTN
ncbi:hypothetical protein E0H26_21265 [Micromonospora zingiberis]|uniref:Uncharacterized protein n=1 Tax=Micromonospora zingiberis TaxID=2053011 RepID=A0A4R0GE62_9ACTN|nr:hypothetical protein [Micromonospora zingiberis]TCB94452.1 hypothetical protein E0H26_21265 [Micromonospora zingiberis]